MAMKGERQVMEEERAAALAGFTQGRCCWWCGHARQRNRSNLKAWCVATGERIRVKAYHCCDIYEVREMNAAHKEESHED